MAEVLKVGYCPICDAEKRVFSSSDHCYCPDCKHHMVWRPVEEDGIEPQEQLKLFTKVWGDGRKEYRYGPEWVAQMLLMEGGYKTPEEAIAAWAREVAR